MMFKKVNKEYLIDRLKKIVTPKVFLLVFLGLIFLFVLILFILLQRQVNVRADQTYEILPGLSSREIAYDLAQKQIINNPKLFNFYIKLKDIDKELQAGRFIFTSDKMTLKELIEFLTSGARAKEMAFTIPEGFTIVQIAALLEEKGLVKASKFVNTATQNDQLFQPNLEGYLFPDTYRIFAGSTSGEIISMMLQNFTERITGDMIKDIKDQDRDFKDALIMASILEREVRTEEDMKMVADILWRRMDAGWALQVDSTLNYILAEDERQAALSSDQLLIDSPYNTYKYQGFPPTPISNPGLKAIKAAIYPTKNDYWFYLSKPDGETVFSKTYDEHLINKANYLE